MTATAIPHTVSISDAGSCAKKLTISIPAATVSERLKTSVDNIVGDAMLPGFRRGRAPRHLVEKKFGSALREDAKRAMVGEAINQAIQDHKLKVVGDATSDMLDKVKVEEGKDLSFDVEVEVMPEFELPALEGLDIKKPTFEITDAMIDDEIKKVCINEGRLETRESPEPGDYLTGHGIMKGADGTEFYNIKGAVVQVPGGDKGAKGMILGVMVEDFAKQLGLPKAGQTATVKTKGPEHHEVEGIRNADLTITFTVERCDRIIPADIAELLPRFGFQSESEMRDAIRQRLQTRALIQQVSLTRQQVAQHLIENTSFELPKRLTAQQAMRTLQRQRLELMYRGFEPAQIEEHVAELRATSAAAAQNELKLFFVLAKAADQLNVQITEGEMNGRIAQLAAERGVRPEQLRQELIARNSIGTVYQQLREHKTIDTILNKSKVEDMPFEKFNEYIEAKNKSKAKK